MRRWFAYASLYIAALALQIADLAVYAQDSTSPSPTPEATVTVASSGPSVVSSPSPAQNISLMLHQTVELDFAPAAALFFVDRGAGKVERVPGVIAPLPATEQVFSERRRYVVGAWVQTPPQVRRAEFSLLITGIKAGVHLVSSQSVEILSGGEALLPVDGLREQLLQKKETLKSWQIQIKAQEESLQRLREDASVIGNLTRIIEVKEEAERIRAHIRNLERDLESLRELLKLARARPLPKNYPAREGELTRQLAELAEAAKSAEAHEFSRKSRAEGDLQRKLAIIEQTRGEDFDRLQRDLVKLRRQRQLMEKDLGSRFNNE